MNDTSTTKMIIAIDGPAASGKGSLAKKLAEKLNYDFLDTGALYRRVALKILEKQVDLTDKNEIIAQTEALKAKLSEKYDDSALRTDNVGSTASIIAQIPEVRQHLIDFQREFTQNCRSGAVLDGRDIGTVICPNADIKFFVTASVEKRAQRRHKELQSKGIDVTNAAVLAEMQERDKRDSGRLDAHLEPGRDVHVIDTSDLTPKQVMDEAMQIIKNRS